MAGVARGNAKDTVNSLTGSGKTGDPPRYPSPTTTTTNECSDDVIVNGVGCVRIGDKVQAHLNITGGTDVSVCTLANTSEVYANGKLVAMVGSQYTTDNIITSGSPDVTID